jgi:hypothetical protein
MTMRISHAIYSVLVVLFLLFLFPGCQQRAFTLIVIGDDETDGAGVFVNGRPVGTIAKEGEQDPQFSMVFPKGTLTVEVKKDGYLPFLEVITVTSQLSEQVHVKLARDTISEEKQSGASADQPHRSSTPANSKLPVCPD